MKRIFAFVFTFIIVGLTVICPSAESGSLLQNRYNVVFVTDASSSMNETDPLGYRFDAIDLFSGLLANKGNRIGSVVFSDGVIAESELAEIDGMASKSKFSNDLRSQPVEGWTDIGGGILEAVNMIERSADKNIPSIIILLTDGNTEMSTDEEYQKSLADKEDAMELARKNGIQIYTISLNANKKADAKELTQIAKATGGEFREVTNAIDLQSVFDLYYGLIYSTQSVKLADEKVPASGKISRRFDVADLGVEEVNIVMFGQTDKYSLTTPSGKVLSGSELNNIKFEGKTFSLVKIEDPAAGKWDVSISTAPGSNIKIFKIYNSNLKLEASVDKPKDSYIKNETVSITANIIENGKAVTDASRYKGYDATLKVYDFEKNEVYSKTLTYSDMSNDGYEFSFKPGDYGTYYPEVSVNSLELNDSVELDPINVGNTAPAVNEEVIEKHINIWPFLIKTDSSVDLSSAASDIEDEELTYKVANSSWMEDDYTLDGTTLTIDKFSVSKGSFEINAYDSLGAYCTFDVDITSTNIGVLAMCIIGSIALVILAAFIITIRRLAGKKFMGVLKIESIKNGKVDEYRPGRGQYKLRSVQVDYHNLDPKSHFQASGKNYVTYVSKKPVYCDYSTNPSKKIKIDTDIEVKISTTEDFSDGMIVLFESDSIDRY